ncbi:MAG: hypothetical protein E7301_00765 [Butyrivibrio sp.]|nr:hypothetical protein [Butyrivibrio sp.]
MMKAIYLSVMEMKILLYRRKIQGLIIFDELNSKIDSQEEVKKAVEKLVFDKYLVPSDDAFTLNDELKEVFDILEKARYTFRIRAMQDMENARCLYMTDNKSLLLNMDNRGTSLIRIETFENEDAIRFIMDSDYMPIASKNGNDGYNEEEQFDFSKAFYESDARLLAERYKRGDSKPDREILVKEGDIKDIIYIKENEKIRSALYNEENFEKAFMEDNDGTC